ncbi:hypothetical protein ACF0H5_010460 [Mactra antiquata]
MDTGQFSQSQMSGETFDFVCTACEQENKTLEAVRYCVECVGYCCQVCTDLHKRFPALKNHNLLGVGQGKQANKQPPRLPEFPTERCSTHVGKVLDMYCEKDDVVGCSTCISKNHRLCPGSQIHSIPDLIGALFNLSNSKKVQSQLKELLVSMTTFGKSKDAKLSALNGAKDIMLQKITNFQKALEAAVKKAAEMSKNELMNAYKKMEQEILEDKSDCQKTNDILQNTSDKLNKAEGNRAQHFVLTKLAEINISETEKKMTEQKKRIKSAEELSFSPNQALMDYINGLQGIGMVVGELQRRSDLYNIGGSKDINIKVHDDSKLCSAAGCCITYNNELLVTDYSGSKLIRIDLQILNVIDFCKLDSIPFGVCCINKHEGAVACGFPRNMIQFVSLDKKMVPTRKIKMSHNCYGITTKDDKLYVTDYKSSLYVYDMTGRLLKTVSHDNTGNQLFYDNRYVTCNERGDRLYISDFNKGIVCLDGDENYLSAYNDKDLNGIDGVCVDGKGNLFVVGCRSHNVVQFSEDGKKIGVVINQQDGLKNPSAVCFDKKLNRLIVAMENSNAVKMYELK